MPNIDLKDKLKKSDTELCHLALTELERLDTALQLAINKRNQAWFEIEEAQSKIENTLTPKLLNALNALSA